MGRRPTLPGPINIPNTPFSSGGHRKWRQFKIAAATAGTNAQSILDSYVEDGTGTALTCDVAAGHQWNTGNFNGDRFYIGLRDDNGAVLKNAMAYNLRVFIETITEPSNNCGLQVVMGFTHQNAASRPIEGVTAPICGVSMKWDTSVSDKRKYRVGGKDATQTSGAQLGDHARSTIMIGTDATESNYKKPLAVFGSGFFLSSSTASSRWEHVVKDPFGTDVGADQGYVVVAIGCTKALSNVTGKFKFWYSVDRMHKGWEP